MLLQPQHLQQSERHADHARHLLLRTTTPYAWGFAELEIDTAALTLGKLALVRAVGVFGDGTVFDMPAVDPLPEPIDIPAGMRDEAVVLALPLRRAGAREADAEEYEELVRHRVLESEVPDSNTAGERTAVLQLGQLHTRLMRASEATDAWTTLGVARVVERRVDNQVQLDRAMLPPLLDVAAHAVIRSWLDELLGLLRQRGEALAGRMTQGGTGGVAEIADFMLLQTVNRNEAVFAHLAKSAMLHPQHFFEHALMPSEALRARFPTQVKIGPVERIRDLVNLALPGVTLTPLPVAPRQIPFHAGANYFELETRNSDLWRQLEQSGGMAMHIAGDFPGLDLAFWAIRS